MSTIGSGRQKWQRATLSWAFSSALALGSRAIAGESPSPVTPPVPSAEPAESGQPGATSESTSKAGDASAGSASSITPAASPAPDTLGGGLTAKSLLADGEPPEYLDDLAVGDGTYVKTDSPVLNDFLEDMQGEVNRRYRGLFDTRSVLTSRRFYDFERRNGVSPSFARFDLPEGSKEDEEIAMASALYAARKTTARTEAMQSILDKLSVIEDLTNWSVEHGENGYREGFAIRSTSRSRSSSGSNWANLKIDSRVALERAVDDPGEILQLRASYQQYVELSVFPVNEQIEMRSPLLKGKNYDLSAAFTVDSGFDRSAFVISFNTRF